MSKAWCWKELMLYYNLSQFQTVIITKISSTTIHLYIDDYTRRRTTSNKHETPVSLCYYSLVKLSIDNFGKQTKGE